MGLSISLSTSRSIRCSRDGYSAFGHAPAGNSIGQFTSATSAPNGVGASRATAAVSVFLIPRLAPFQTEHSGRRSRRRRNAPQASWPNIINC